MAAGGGKRHDVIFDLAGDPNWPDSTGLGLLIRLRKRARELGHQWCWSRAGTFANGGGAGA
jgi:anti-anti-sigma regulatory factor